MTFVVKIMSDASPQASSFELDADTAPQAAGKALESYLEQFGAGVIGVNFRVTVSVERKP